MVRRAALGTLAAAVIVVAAVVLLSSNGQPHRLRAIFESALQVSPGQQVRIAGRPVGSIESVSLDGGQAVVAMSLSEQAWPLHQGTTAALRFGSAAGYADRYIELHPGPSSAQTLPDNGILPSADTVTPVEFDQVFNIFNQPTRHNVAGLLNNAQQTLTGQATNLRRDLELSPAGLQQTAAFEADLGSDPNALNRLVGAATATARALASRDTQLGDLADGAATTFQALAVNAAAQQSALDRLPSALGAGELTLAHLDRSLGPLDTLVKTLAPGAAGLREVAPVLTQTLDRLLTVAPLASATLRSGTNDVPALSRFLKAGTPFVPSLSTALARLAPMVSCVRPYTPEIAGFASTWTGFSGHYDGYGHYARILVQLAATLPPGETLGSAQVVGQSRGAISYAMPRPPGLNAGQPWFQPQCGAGPGALNPALDPESGR